MIPCSVEDPATVRGNQQKVEGEGKVVQVGQEEHYSLILMLSLEKEV